MNFKCLFKHKWAKGPTARRGGLRVYRKQCLRCGEIR